MKFVRGRKKTLTMTTIVLAQPPERVEDVVVRGGGKMIQPVYKENSTQKPEKSSIIQKKSSRSGSNQKKISFRSDSKFN